MKATTEEVIRFLNTAKRIGTEKWAIDVAIHKLAELEYDIGVLLDMLTDQFRQANPGEQTPPDWLTMAHSLVDAKEGKSRTVTEIIGGLGDQ